MNFRTESDAEDELCPRCGARHRGEQSACPAALVGRTIAGRFHVVRLIGSGGSASVYKAQNLAIGRFVAVKILHPYLRGDTVAVERFVREGRAMSRVRHEGVVDVLDLITSEEGAPMLVLEYVRGRTLAAEIKRSSGFPLARAMDLAGQLLATLAAIHERGLVHRDLKPSNLIAGVDARRRERLKIADFGLALDIRSLQRQERVRVTPPGRVLATPRYLAPELLRGGEGDDPRVDIYGVGLVIYEMLIGRPAYAATDIDELADAILHARPPSATAARSDVPAALDQVIARALAKWPGERFPTAYAMLEALRPFGASSEVTDAEPTDSELIEMPRRAAPSPGDRPTAHPHSIFPRPNEGDITTKRQAIQAPLDRDPVVKIDRAALHAAALAARPSPALVQPVGSASQSAVAPAQGASESEWTPHMRVRGAMGATLVTALRRRYGDEAVDDLLSGLPHEVRAVLAGPIVADEWIDGIALRTLLEAADVHLGRGDGALFVGFGRVAARALLPGGHADLLHVATPESALIDAGRLWKTYFEFGELRALAVGRGYGKLELRGKPPRRSTCMATAGFLEVLLELAGARDVEIAIPTCRALGDHACIFDASWMV